MDVILQVADQYVLDRVYAYLVPFAPTVAAATALPGTLSSNSTLLNGTFAAAAQSTPAPATWSHLLPFLSAGKDAGAAPILASASKFALASHSAGPLVSAWPRDHIMRQVLSLAGLTLVGIHILYFTFAWASYKWLFNHDMMKHPRFLKNQVRQEIMCSLRGIPCITAMTLPWFLAEVRGYSMMYNDVSEYGWTWLIASIVM
jgi:lathosterol oxidase